MSTALAWGFTFYVTIRIVASIRRERRLLRAVASVRRYLHDYDGPRPIWTWTEEPS